MSGPVSAARWWLRALLVPGCGLALLASAPALAQAGPSGRAGPGASRAAATVTLNNDGAAVKTSNGQSWAMEVADSTIADTLTVSIERTVSAGGKGAEEHLWYFDAKASSLKFSPSTGDGTLTGGSATSPLATIKLTFKATSHQPASCLSGSETIYQGTLSGEAKLVTGLTVGGTIGGKRVTFNAPASSPEVLVDSGCVPSTDQCTAAIIFSSAVTGAKPEAAGFTGTESGKKYDFVTVARKVTLKSPAGAYRVDAAVADASPPSWNPKSHVLSVSTTSAGIVTGSAKLTGGTPKTASYPCSYAGKSYTVTATDNTTANYASPSGKTITGHTSLTGTLKAPVTKKAATYVVTTVSP